MHDISSPLSGHTCYKKLDAKDFLLTGEKFDLYHDADWDMLITIPVPEHPEKYYQSDAYKPHQHRSKSILDKIYNYIRKRGYNYKLNIIKSFHPKAKSILDYGTATGEFLQFMQQETFLVSGVEPNEMARKQANTILNDKVSVSIDAISGSYDVITLWHVLEHLPDLDFVIEKLKQHLRPGGIILVAVPNFKSYDARYYKAHWAAYDVPRHLWHFSPLSIQKLFNKHQLEIKVQKPLFFDSFYVSLLSEQYKTGKKRLFSAFFRGLLSNIKARKTGQYSSMIYVISSMD